MKTRKAYGVHKETKKEYYLGDTLDAALKANMMLPDYEKALVKANPQLDIIFKIEKK